MSGVAAAIAGSAIVGGIVSDRASGRAADTAQRTSDAQLAYQEAQNEQARGDVTTGFSSARENQLMGAQRQLDMLSLAAPLALDARLAGNFGAQNVVSGGTPQAINALLGGPIDYSFLQPQRVENTLAQLLAGVPQVYAPQQQPAAQPAAQPAMVNPFTMPNFGGSDFRDFLFNSNVQRM